MRREFFYFKTDGDAANFDLNISQPDGTEIFDGELTFSGCITYNDTKPNFSLISNSNNNESYETFVQLKEGTKAIYAQTAGKTVMLNAKIVDGKITTDFTKKGNNSVLFNITQNETTTFSDIVDIEGSLTLDTLQRKLSVKKGTKITAAEGYSIKNSVLTFDKEFLGTALDLTNYEVEVTKIDGSKLKNGVKVIANNSANSIKDGASNNTFTGGKGEDSIVINEEISNVTYSGNNVIFTVGEGSLTVKNAKDKEITVTDDTDNIQTYSRSLEILYDNNFMTDEINISDVAEVTAKNYSVGQIETLADNEKIGNVNSVVFLFKVLELNSIFRNF